MGEESGRDRQLDEGGHPTTSKDWRRQKFHTFRLDLFIPVIEVYPGVDNPSFPKLLGANNRHQNYYSSNRIRHKDIIAAQTFTTGTFHCPSIFTDTKTIYQ